jgi:imidazolonepropionase-like amidohydrolase
MALLVALSAGPVPAAFAVPSQEQAETWTIYADRVYSAPGSVVEGGVVVIKDGKVASVTKGGSNKEDALRAFAVTAGMIDLGARIHNGQRSVEQSREVTPEARVSASLNLFDPAWMRAARTGVTSVMITPPDENVIGGLCVALKTHGSSSLAARALKLDCALRGAIGTQPSRRNHPAFRRADDFYSRRPTTRMGVEWVMRKAFYDAAYSRNDPARAFAGSRELLEALDGKRPFVVQAWTTQDIRTAVYLREEMAAEGFGDLRLIIDAGAEAWREPDLLVRTKTGVILPPFPWQGRTQDAALMPFNTARVLLDRGVPVALSSHGAAPADQRLDRQAGFAMRGGLSFDEALAAVTTTPAEMIGVSDRIGTLDAGKDGDLVMWSGPPFEATSRVVGVLIDGQLVLDPRPAVKQ